MEHLESNLELDSDYSNSPIKKSFEKSMEKIDQLIFELKVEEVLDKCNFLTNEERNLSIIKTLYRHRNHRLFLLELEYQRRRLEYSDAFFRGDLGYVGESWIDNFYKSNKFNTEFLYKIQLIFFIFSIFNLKNKI